MIIKVNSLPPPPSDGKSGSKAYQDQTPTSKDKSIAYLRKAIRRNDLETRAENPYQIENYDRRKNTTPQQREQYSITSPLSTQYSRDYRLAA